MKKLFLLLFSVLAFTSQVRADVEWTIWEGSINMSTTKGEWNNSLYLNNNNFKNLAKGDKLHLEFSKNAGVEGDAQIALDYQVEKVKKPALKQQLGLRHASRISIPVQVIVILILQMKYWVILRTRTMGLIHIDSSI